MDSDSEKENNLNTDYMHDFYTKEELKYVDNLSVGDNLTIRFKSGSVITKVSKIDERKFI